MTAYSVFLIGMGIVLPAQPAPTLPRRSVHYMSLRDECGCDALLYKLGNGQDPV
jgi:hypothetical protein